MLKDLYFVHLTRKDICKTFNRSYSGCQRFLIVKDCKFQSAFTGLPCPNSPGLHQRTKKPFFKLHLL